MHTRRVKNARPCLDSLEGRRLTAALGAGIATATGAGVAAVVRPAPPPPPPPLNIVLSDVLISSYS